MLQKRTYIIIPYCSIIYRFYCFSRDTTNVILLSRTANNSTSNSARKAVSAALLLARMKWHKLSIFFHVVALLHSLSRLFIPFVLFSRFFFFFPPLYIGLGSIYPVYSCCSNLSRKFLSRYKHRAIYL